MNSRGSRQLHAPGRHPCGPGCSQRTGSLVTLCAQHGARWCQHGRGGHKCVHPTMALLLPEEVAPLGVALGGKGGLMRDERGCGSKQEWVGEASPEHLTCQDWEEFWVPGGCTGSQTEAVVGGIPGQREVEREFLPLPKCPRAPTSASPPAKRLPQPVTQQGVPGGGQAPGSGRHTGWTRELRGTGRRSCSSARSPRAPSSE